MEDSAQVEQRKGTFTNYTSQSHLMAMLRYLKRFLVGLGILLLPLLTTIRFFALKMEQAPREFSIIEPETFFDSTNEDLLRLIYREFSPELERLTRATSIPNKLAIKPTTPSPSQIIYKKNYDEINRTLVGILSLRWLHDRNYEAFVGSQEESVKLSKELFNWLCQIFEYGLKDPAHLDVLVTSMVINDLGKDPQLAVDYNAKTGDDISGLNHDMILLKAVEIGLVGCLDRLPAVHKSNLIRGLKLGAEFNFGQLAQAENVPASLAGLLDIEKDDSMFDFRFMEQILDISGAAGHSDWTCAKKMIGPICQAYHNSYDAATSIISGKLALRDGYDLILVRRGELLRTKGFRILDIKEPQDRAVMRLLCMGGAVDLATANLYEKAWLSLDESTRNGLIESLTVDGEVGKPAVQATYFPALLSKALDSARSKGEDGKVKTLQSCFRFLRRLLKIEEPINNGRVTVVERDLQGIVNDVITNPAFQADPDMLDNEQIPGWEVAKLG